MDTWYNEKEEAAARSYEWGQSVLFLLRFALLIILAALFWTSGLSHRLADGLRTYFSGFTFWPLIYICFAAFSVMAYEIILFPLSVLSSYSLEDTHQQPPESFGGWLAGYLVSLVVAILIWTAGFTAFYVLLWLFPTWWWLAAGGLYALFVIGLSVWGPSLLLPRVRPPKPVNDAALLEKLQKTGEAAFLQITGLAKWPFDDDQSMPPVVLSGTGSKRCVVFSSTVWDTYGTDEKVFAAARQMAGHKGHADLKLIALQIILALGVLFGADRATTWFAVSRGFPDKFAPELMPFWMVAFFSLAAFMSVFIKHFKQREELRRDRFALRQAGGCGVLLSCLQQDFKEMPFAVDAPWWQRLLLRDTPTATQRLALAERIGP